jgi:Flp pilus assembly protein TadD
MGQNCDKLGTPERSAFGYDNHRLACDRRCVPCALSDASAGPIGPRRLEPNATVIGWGLLLTLLVFPGCAQKFTPAAGGSGSIEEYTGKLRELGVRARPPAGGAATLEAQDPVLAAALLDLSVHAGPDQHRRVAARFHQLGILDTAHDHYSRARQLDPADSAANDGLARIWRDWGFPHLALGDALRSVYYGPRRASAHNTLGTILTRLGRLREARDAYEQARTFEPRAAYILNNLCYLSFLEGRPAHAIDECRAALDVDPAFGAARNNLALAYAAARKGDLAQQEFLAAGDAAAALYNVGIVRLAEKEYAKASEAFEAAQRHRPSWTAARERAMRARALAAVDREAVSP